MAAKYSVQRKPYLVPTTDDKIIREHFGFLSNWVEDMSLAHMTAPPRLVGTRTDRAV